MFCVTAIICSSVSLSDPATAQSARHEPPIRTRRRVRSRCACKVRVVGTKSFLRTPRGARALHACEFDFFRLSVALRRNALDLLMELTDALCELGDWPFFTDCRTSNRRFSPSMMATASSPLITKPAEEPDLIGLIAFCLQPRLASAQLHQLRSDDPQVGASLRIVQN